MPTTEKLTLVPGGSFNPYKARAATRFPSQPRIENGPEAEQLYQIEERRNNLIKAAAREQGRIQGFSEKDFWTHAMPEQLASILESFDRASSEAAALAFLLKRGYVIVERMVKE